MSSKWFTIIVLCTFLFISGCETAKGFKKDMGNAWSNLKKLDKDFKENWW